jgi:hypothetical protein
MAARFQAVDGRLKLLELKPGWYAGDMPKTGDPGPELLAWHFPDEPGKPAGRKRA